MDSLAGSAAYRFIIMNRHAPERNAVLCTARIATEFIAPCTARIATEFMVPTGLMRRPGRHHKKPRRPRRTRRTRRIRRTRSTGTAMTAPEDAGVSAPAHPGLGIGLVRETGAALSRGWLQCRGAVRALGCRGLVRRALRRRPPRRPRGSAVRPPLLLSPVQRMRIPVRHGGGSISRSTTTSAGMISTADSATADAVAANVCWARWRARTRLALEVLSASKERSRRAPSMAVGHGSGARAAKRTRRRKATCASRTSRRLRRRGERWPLRPCAMRPVPPSSPLGAMRLHPASRRAMQPHPESALSDPLWALVARCGSTRVSRALLPHPTVPFSCPCARLLVDPEAYPAGRGEEARRRFVAPIFALAMFAEEDRRRWRAFSCSSRHLGLHGVLEAEVEEEEVIAACGWAGGALRPLGRTPPGLRYRGCMCRPLAGPLDLECICGSAVVCQKTATASVRAPTPAPATEPVPVLAPAHVPVPAQAQAQAQSQAAQQQSTAINSNQQQSTAININQQRPTSTNSNQQQATATKRKQQQATSSEASNS